MPAIYDKPINPLLLTDFYKICHRAFYNRKLSQLVSYWTPRKSRIEGVDYSVMFGLQAYMKKYLIDYFNVNFFEANWDDIASDYMETIGPSMSYEIAEEELKAFKELHDLGYLPLLISAVPEGSIVPVRVPMIKFEITDSRFYWLINYLETLTSCNIWFPMTSATIAHTIRADVVNPWYDKTVDDDIARSSACGDFSMRGMTSPESAPMADAGHLLSFISTATCPSLPWLKNFYNAKGVFAKGTPSTEHSVMESYLPENEFECYRHLIEDVMPNGPLSIVSDTWNLWNVITDYLPRLKNSIMNRDGKIIIRPDSGDPVDILCGTLKTKNYMTVPGLEDNIDAIRNYFANRASEDFTGHAEAMWYRVRIGDNLYTVECPYASEPDEEDPDEYVLTSTVYSCEVDVSCEKITPEMKGVIELLWDIFGGKVNSKGYKVLNSHIGAIYGDAITPARANIIYTRLAAKGFAANNVVLGIGSYTYQYVTRDSLGFALKVTCGTIDGVETPMFKDPITDKVAGNSFKKSQKGLCYVTYGDDGRMTYTDGWTSETLADEEKRTGKKNLLIPVFKDGKLLVDYTLDEIRDRLNDGKF